MHSREERCFKPSNEEPVSCQLSEAIDSVLKKCKDSPANVQARDQPMNRDVCEKEEERDLAKDGANDVEGL